jgi:hypothetical protein
MSHHDVDEESVDVAVTPDSGVYDARFLVTKKVCKCRMHACLAVTPARTHRA